MKLKSVKYYWITILWAIIIFILSSISSNNFEKIPKFKIPHLDKLIHFTMYFILAFLLFRSLKQISKRISIVKFPIVSTLLICILYGGIIEVLQEYVFSGRSMDVYDFMANVIGVAVGLLFSFIIKRKNHDIII